MVEIRSVGKYKISIHGCSNSLHLYQQEGTQKMLLKEGTLLTETFSKSSRAT